MGAWGTIGELGDYPATTATNHANLEFGQAFTLQLASPVKALAVRVLGVPACGDNAKCHSRPTEPLRRAARKASASPLEVG